MQCLYSSHFADRISLYKTNTPNYWNTTLIRSGYTSQTDVSIGILVLLAMLQGLQQEVDWLNCFKKLTL